MMMQFLQKEFEIPGSLVNENLQKQMKNDLNEEALDLYLTYVYYVNKMIIITEEVVS